MAKIVDSGHIADCGHYVAPPVPDGPSVLTVGPGQSCRRVFLSPVPSVPSLPEGISDMPAGLDVLVGPGASLELCFIILPGASAELPVNVDLAGEGSSVLLSGLYLCASDEKVSLKVNMHHRVPGCESRQVFKGILGGDSSSDFYGRIIVAPGALRTEAYQENHNIVLSDGARAETRPQLEIYADDVKCSHGATVGRFDDQELFYMRSRGIDGESARRLQMVSFLSAVLDTISEPSEKEYIASLVEASLAKLS